MFPTAKSDAGRGRRAQSTEQRAQSSSLKWVRAPSTTVTFPKKVVVSRSSSATSTFPSIQHDPTTSTMETLPDELLLRIMELACDETQIDEPLAHSQVWGLHNGFTQSRDLEWVLEKSSNAREAFATGSDTTNTPYVARIADTPEIHVNRLRSSMRTKRVSPIFESAGRPNLVF